jgi:hypothetical protein
MNRSLWIPAVCCSVAFAALLVVLHAVAGRNKPAESRHTVALPTVGNPKVPDSTLVHVASQGTPAAAESLRSVKECEQLLTALTGEYLRPWRRLESSPQRLYSRAAPRPIPTISADVEIWLAGFQPTDSFVVATISISKGTELESVPCVINRHNGQTQFFAQGRWLLEDEWLKLAPLP